MPVGSFTDSILEREGVQAANFAETMVWLCSLMLLNGSELPASTVFQAHDVMNQLWFSVVKK